MESIQTGQKFSEKGKSEILKRITDLKTYSHEMYGMRDIFQPAIDFGGRKITWRDIYEILTLGDDSSRERFLEKIECASFLMQNRQQENILTQYKLRFESDKDKTRREYIESLMGHNSKRRITFPFYNMELTKAQNDLLFYGTAAEKSSPKH